ncbi:hypothetical protein [Hymenobacter sp.]|jgi:hypothetical protein|uniref:glycosyl-4,4'-diaponeurosporenoate acyltransferase CrtO family protein n=1 Tax=Hymenobacter sp. TaxID=1898978 RepID=UPI002ED8E535
MPPIRKQAAVPSPALLAFYNAVPNVFWSVLSFTPLCVFCYQHIARPWIYGFLAVSLLAYAVPASSFRYWQLSATLTAYRKLGVPLANHLAQHGDLVNKLVRRQYPQYRHVRTHTSVAALVRTTYHQERFHVAMFLFFLLSAIYAAIYRYWGWMLLLTLLNTVYNLYPIWLQQYIRVRLTSRSSNFN